MNEANTTYRWQMPYCIAAKTLRASYPVPLFRTQSKFGLAWANEVSASKQASKQPSADDQADRCFTRQAQACRSHSEPTTFPSCIRSASLHPVFRSGDSFNCIHADTGIFVPVPAFFISRNTSRPRIHCSGHAVGNVLSLRIV